MTPVLLGRGLRAEVLAHEGGALKLYPPEVGAAEVFAEAAKQAAAVEAGAPAPAVRAAGRYGDRWGLEMDLCPGPSLAERMVAPGADLPALLAEMADLHRQIHALPARRLPGQRDRLSAAILRTPLLEVDERAALLAGLAATPSGPGRLCHGDFHPANILGPPGALRLIDWVDATAGEPMADVGRTYLLLHLAAAGLADGYLDAYCNVGTARREAVLAWLPVLAAARLAEGAPAETAQLLALARGGAPAAGTAGMNR